MTEVSDGTLPACNPAGAWRHAPLAIRRDVGGSLPHQGFVYDSAEARSPLQRRRPRFRHSRYANPTVAMFEERMRLLEGADAARAVASGMAAVSPAVLSTLKAGDHVVGEGALRLVRLRDRRTSAALRDHLDPGRRPRPEPVEEGGEAGDQALFLESPRTRRSS